MHPNAIVMLESGQILARRSSTMSSRGFLIYLTMSTLRHAKRKLPLCVIEESKHSHYICKCCCVLTKDTGKCESIR